jgi:hypothetical protein
VYLGDFVGHDEVVKARERKEGKGREMAVWGKGRKSARESPVTFDSFFCIRSRLQIEHYYNRMKQGNIETSKRKTYQKREGKKPLQLRFYPSLLKPSPSSPLLRPPPHQPTHNHSDHLRSCQTSARTSPFSRSPRHPARRPQRPVSSVLLLPASKGRRTASEQHGEPIRTRALCPRGTWCGRLAREGRGKRRSL